MNDRTVAIIDGGGANIASLRFALDRLGYQGKLTVDPGLIRDARRVILPGVGDAGDAMRRLSESRLDELIPELTQPVLGICLGMQLLFEASDENSTRCLGILAGTARELQSTSELSVPHMGWNSITSCKPSQLLEDIPDGAYFYFVHSYALGVTEDSVATTDHGITFTSVAERANFSATQFHPERSGRNGAQLLSNFLAGSTRE